MERNRGREVEKTRRGVEERRGVDCGGGEKESR